MSVSAVPVAKKLLDLSREEQIQLNNMNLEKPHF